jgi:hypothetical protein
MRAGFWADFGALVAHDVLLAQAETPPRMELSSPYRQKAPERSDRANFETPDRIFIKNAKNKLLLNNRVDFYFAILS